MSMAFQNSGCSIARKGRFDNIKKTISCSLYAAWVNLGMTFALEAYIYYFRTVCQHSPAGRSLSSILGAGSGKRGLRYRGAGLDALAVAVRDGIVWDPPSIDFIDIYFHTVKQR